MQKFDLESTLAVKIRKQMVQAISEYDMIRNNERIMVCVSGGKDSTILLALLTEIRRRSKRSFAVEAAILDQKQPGFEVNEFKNFVENVIKVKLHIIERDTYSIVKEKVTDGVYCSLCSRLRRAILYDYAFNNGFTRLALGHHRSDLIETTLLNLFYTGRLASMPPKLKSDDQRSTLIRPLCFVDEEDLIALAKEWNFPIIPCRLCGTQEGMKRQRMKSLIKNLETEIPAIQSSVITALSNIQPSQLLDKELWSFDF